MKALRSVNPAIALVVAVAIVAAILLFVLPGGGQTDITADFPRALSLYKGSDVRILGVAVGKVDDVTPDGTHVVVKFHFDNKYKVPANAKAVVISPSIVGDRFIQLTPAYTSGPTLQNNATLGLDRTATPLELDEIFGSIHDLTKALGPQGPNKPDPTGTGSLTPFPQPPAKRLRRQGGPACWRGGRSPGRGCSRPRAGP